MQKLKERNTYTPTDVQSLLVRSNCDSVLNREETLSVQGLKTSFNNPEGVQPVLKVQGSLKPLKTFLFNQLSELLKKFKVKAIQDF